MKSKTKVLFVTLGVVLLTLSIFTVKLSLSQREMKQSLAEAQMMASTKTDNQAPMIRAAYMPNGENDSFVDAAANTVNTVVHIRTEIITKGSSYYDFFGYMLEQLYGDKTIYGVIQITTKKSH